ncbi:MAG: dihydrodipicolinate synthase family protein [Alphaproteobacteria bacterium]|jgi:dihydrodipicolinate synthase/N-acetylneuraminate lyase|nr:dihydrodipicolinate synthase family protein [Rhodospirillaceae bacterium]MBT7648597.1 dihydrodipicolinate synthase family protein [Rhodospirillaceae bacterium]MDG2482364.1 dihydrodipicolinate synthase family protein [Alphaproteobacteria bacterium]
MTNLSGVVPAVVTPFTRDGAFNERAFRDMLEYNIQAGVHGFWIGGGSGESVMLDDEENLQIAKAAAEQGAGRVTNIMHIGASTTRRAVAMAENAAKAGVQALCCVPPFFYEVTDEAIIEHYRAVGAATDLPLMLYNLPQSTNVEITPALARRIRDAVPTLAGLKHSGPVVEHIREFADLDLACFIGNSVLMLPGLTIGACGCVDGPLAVVPELWVDIWKAWQASDLAGATAAQQRATLVAQSMMEFGFIEALKAGITERLGIDCGNPRLPMLPLSADQRAEMIGRMRELSVMDVEQRAAS